MRTRFIAYAALMCCSSPAAPGMARPAGGTQDPQISYVASARGYDLVIANEDGSGARSIYKSSRMVKGELGPDGMIYFWDGGRFQRMPAAGGTAQFLFDTGRTTPSPSDIAPNGTSVAWYDANGGALMRYYIGSGSQSTLSQVGFVIDLTFDHTGSAVIFAEQVSNTEYEVKSVPATGGSPATLGLVGRISSFDSARRDGTLALTFNPAGGSPYIAVWKPGMTGAVRIADGYAPTYRCDDSAILYQRMTPSGSALFIRLTNGAISQVAKPNSVFPSYKPLC